MTYYSQIFNISHTYQNEFKTCYIRDVWVNYSQFERVNLFIDDKLFITEESFISNKNAIMGNDEIKRLNLWESINGCLFLPCFALKGRNLIFEFVTLFPQEDIHFTIDWYCAGNTNNKIEIPIRFEHQKFIHKDMVEKHLEYVLKGCNNILYVEDNFLWPKYMSIFDNSVINIPTFMIK